MLLPAHPRVHPCSVTDGNGYGRLVVLYDDKDILKCAVADKTSLPIHLIRHCPKYRRSQSVMEITVMTLEGKKTAINVPENCTTGQLRRSIASALGAGADTVRRVMQAACFVPTSLQITFIAAVLHSLWPAACVVYSA